LVGREEELELLLRRWRQANAGEGRVVLLTGEPGIGKSRLVVALQKAIEAEPHVRLRYFCSPQHTGSPLYPIISQLERAAGFERGDAPAQKLLKLQTLLGPAVSDQADEAVLLADLLSVPTNGRHRPPEMSPQKRKEKTLDALLAQVARIGERKPVLMIFEDVHWIDPTTLELLALTVEQLPHLRVLLLITARPEFTPPWPVYAHVTTVSLAHLSPREAPALMNRVTGGKMLPDEVASQILVRTDGVPLFIEELTKTVLESGLLRKREHDFALLYTSLAGIVSDLLARLKNNQSFSSRDERQFARPCTATRAQEKSPGMVGEPVDAPLGREKYKHVVAQFPLVDAYFRPAHPRCLTRA
jgi:predicted ATPase